MRTLTLLAALLLLAFQAQAQTLQETADQVPTQEQPGLEDQDLLGDEDQDMAISLTEEERFTRQLSAFPQKAKKIIAKIFKRILAWLSARIKRKALRKSCLCLQKHQCPDSKVNKVLQRVSWACRIFGRQYKLCCK